MIINGVSEIKRSPIQNKAKWLFTSDILPAFAKALATSPILLNVFKKNIYPYHRHDIPINNLPALCITVGDIIDNAQYGGYETVEMCINIIMPLNETREVVMFDIEAIRAILQQCIKDVRYGASINDSITIQDRIIEFMFGFSNLSPENKEIISNANLFGLWGINYRSHKPYIETSPKGSKFRVCENTFEYQYNRGGYYKMMENLGVNAYVDPEKIVYQQWEADFVEINNGTIINGATE